MPKSIPQRQCVGCREKKPKPELIRVVRAPDGAISLDARGKAAGRGAYLCPKAVCLKKAQKNRALERAHPAVALGDVDQLKNRFQADSSQQRE